MDQRAANWTVNRALLSVARAHETPEDRLFLLHEPGHARGVIGWGPGRVVWIDTEHCCVEEAGARQTQPAGADPFFQAASALDSHRPLFFMASLDRFRQRPAPGLPLFYFYQPDHWIEFRHEASGLSVHGPDAAEVKRLRLEREPAPASFPLDGASLSRWDNEGDAAFLARLEHAVGTLRGRYGKMILMRPFSRAVRPDADTLRLFDLYSGLEPGCAASHFARLAPDLCSMGCSPENVFELDGDQLTYDVVAGTRGVSADAAEDARWAAELLADEKERQEHEMALARYEVRMQELCAPGCVRRDLHRSVRQLACVRHLHSRLTGRLRQPRTWWMLCADHYPPLCSYPDELIPLADPHPEPTRFYGGLVGYAPAGHRSMASYLNLRSLLIHGDRMYTEGGVGVIGASIPRQELLEVHNKLRALASAVHQWQPEGV